MSIANLVSRASGNGSDDKVPYTLNEVLAILEMVEAKVSKKDIVEITGRSAHSLQYKIFERQTTINGKTNCRSIMKHLLVNPTVKGDTSTHSEETFLANLYKSFGVEVPVNLSADAAERSQQWVIGKGLAIAQDAAVEG
jgi:hypothetical protein